MNIGQQFSLVAPLLLRLGRRIRAKNVQFEEYRADLATGTNMTWNQVKEFL
jgi:hypothetical protein